METGKHNINDPSGMEPGYSRMERIRQYIDENLSGDLKAAAVSQQFELSASTLLHLFQQHQQQSYQRYIEEVRMNKAMELLRAGKWIQEIMGATGYQSRSAFYRAFKRRFKYSPRHFQK